jgi:hypothetical protein
MRLRSARIAQPWRTRDTDRTEAFSDERKHGHSPDDVSSWLSFAVFTANCLLIRLLSPGKSWIFDRSADSEGKR